jgi:hypothetical protein
LKNKDKSTGLKCLRASYFSVVFPELLLCLASDLGRDPLALLFEELPPVRHLELLLKKLQYLTTLFRFQLFSSHSALRSPHVCFVFPGILEEPMEEHGSKAANSNRLN